jgi:hypothetical protein
MSSTAPSSTSRLPFRTYTGDPPTDPIVEGQHLMLGFVIFREFGGVDRQFTGRDRDDDDEANA